MTAYADLIAADGAQLYWPMQEASGTTCTDSIRSTTLTAHSTVTVGGGSAPFAQQDRSVSYGGGYMDFTFPTALQVAPTAFTWECWFYLTTNSGFHGPIKLGFGASEIYNLTGQNKLRLDLYNSGGTPTTIDTSVLSSFTNTWHHLVITKSGTTVTIYIDGASVASGTFTGTLAAPVTGQVGESGNLWSGYLADAAYYTTALTNLQVANHYGAHNSAAGASTTSLLIPFESTWKYDHYLQTVNGPDETQGYTRHDPTYDDSAWVSGTAIVGWTTITATNETIRTNVPLQHEVWLRKTLGVVASMTITVKCDDYYWLYVNGNLVANGSQSDATPGNTLAGPFSVPAAYLNVSGQNVIAYHVQDNLPVFGAGDRLMADVKVEMTLGGWRVGAIALN